MREIFHVTHNKITDNWEVKKAGFEFPVATFGIKTEAVNTAVSLAKSAQLGQVKIHGLDGKIQNEWTYGKDPRRYLS